MNNNELIKPPEDNKNVSSVIEKLIHSLVKEKNYLLIAWERIYQRTLLLELSKRINLPGSIHITVKKYFDSRCGNPQEIDD